MKIAIPTEAPGGLDAGRSGHFGHCEMFTVVEMAADHQIIGVDTIINEGHEAGGCMAPVTMLQQAGVDAIVVAGLGRRPMEGFTQAGITVYFADPDQAADVRGVLDWLSRNKLVVMHPDQACQGSSSCSH